MKRVGILTLSASDNCGSLLQTYALQQVLTGLGYEDIEIIDFQSAMSKRIYDVFPDDLFKQPRKLISTIFHMGALKKQKNDYNLFRKEQLKLSGNKYTCAEDMHRLDLQYDVVICGSDQIWNVRMRDFDEAFFLADIKDIKKIAYAASLGGTSFSAYKSQEQLKKWILDFSHISVREEQGKEEVKFFYDKVEVLLDPTLLLEKGEWNRLAGEVRLVKENYIFYYSWSYGDRELLEKVKFISKELKKPVYVINASKWLLHSYKKYGFNLFPKGGPYVFLNLIKYADLVFVESLHGTIFSAIFEKNFWYLNGIEDGSMDSRNQYLLSLLGMSHRIINKRANIDLNCIKQNIDYKVKNANLEDLISSSKRWLVGSLEQ